MSKLSLSQELVNEMLNYLSRRPYMEVAALLDRLSAEIVPQVKQPSPVVPETLKAKSEKANEAKPTKPAKAVKAANAKPELKSV